MKYFATPQSVGVWQTFLVMAALYLIFMMIGAFSYRLPPLGWKPAGWTPPAADNSAKAMITSKNVHLNTAWKTPQFWLIWGVLCLNVSAGIGILGMASPTGMDAEEIFRQTSLAPVPGVATQPSLAASVQAVLRDGVALQRVEAEHLTPSGERRIWPKNPSSMTNRPALRSSDFNASIVSRTYWTVRSNSASASFLVLPISHIVKRTTDSRTFTMPATNFSVQAIRRATRIVGQAPRPSFHARHAASRAPSAAASSSCGIRPTMWRASEPSAPRTHTGESTFSPAPSHTRISPSTK
jgi:hypothetical protein